MNSRYKFALLFLAALCGRAEVTVLLPAKAHPLERLSANELASHLSRIYAGERITVADRAPAGGVVIEFTRRPGPKESYSVTASGSRAQIASADPRGALYAVYALLEKLGCGFYLSTVTLPAPRPGPLRLDGWQLRDEPVFADRIVFDWHNFLSSASTWEFEDWQRYIDNSARMRFNGIMVHAYGNNPMFTFRFAGLDKPVGHLATTQAGRDWGTEHVNDVRRLVGGDLFTEPVFGSSVAKAEAGQRAKAATKLMQRVFEHAASRGMGVTFALDVDTESANPQAMIATLPASARIKSGKFQLANPDTPEGYAFYRAQVEQLLATYPQITRLAVWHRNNATPWMEVKAGDFPQAWKAEFRGDPADAPMFAMGRVVAAFGKALRETGHGSVELASGTWRFHLLKGADRYFPREATLMPLDWSTVFDTAGGQRALRSVTSGRKMLPIVWAHHDDRTYIGRPYTPYVNFPSLVKSAGGSGFGIIHWTTRPLDLYFKSTVMQTWKASESQPLEIACEHMAARLFGEPSRESGRDYLFSFVTEGPMFGRETTDRFMDILLADPAGHLKKSAERLALLSKIDAAALSTQARDQLAYFHNYETFIRRFFEAQSAFEKADAAIKASNYEAARMILKDAAPEEAIRLYMLAARTGGATPGEKAIVISLNLRWLPYFLSLRQAAGMEPARYKLGKVEQESLAQAPGRLTFHVDESGRLWRVLDSASSKSPMTLGAILGDRLAAGRYSINGATPVEARDGKVEVALPAGSDEIVITRVQ